MLFSKEIDVRAMPILMYSYFKYCDSGKRKWSMTINEVSEHTGMHFVTAKKKIQHLIEQKVLFYSFNESKDFYDFRPFHNNVGVITEQEYEELFKSNANYLIYMYENMKKTYFDAIRSKDIATFISNQIEALSQ